MVVSARPPWPYHRPSHRGCARPLYVDRDASFFIFVNARCRLERCKCLLLPAKLRWSRPPHPPSICKAVPARLHREQGVDRCHAGSRPAARQLPDPPPSTPSWAAAAVTRHRKGPARAARKDSSSRAAILKLPPATARSLRLRTAGSSLERGGTPARHSHGCHRAWLAGPGRRSPAPSPACLPASSTDRRCAGTAV